MNTPRLGHIHFLNVLPLTYGLNTLNLKDGIQLKNGVPAVMNNDLLTGRLDASEVSSIVYARNYEDLLILPDLCVRADGPVQSILLVSRKPMMPCMFIITRIRKISIIMIWAGSGKSLRIAAWFMLYGL